ncbi:hypothetical protein [Luteimonas suaedae]|uniref:hypothetical protein n=1 Tax=Luteimonas suaedae TaxID=2605430 RepID=UPI0011EEC0E3|nr:hypothetical protein [Luteimonas suaedae]
MDVKANRFLVVYSGLLTVVFAVTVLAGAAGLGKASFEEVDVQRINVREADGRLRMVISGNTRAPGAYLHGEEHPHPNAGKRGAGMWFLNDEGTESGGLSHQGKTLADGKSAATMQLAFDQYDQDQTLTLKHEEYDGVRYTGLRIDDRPDKPIGELVAEVERARALPQPEQGREIARLEAAYPRIGRLFVGRDEQRASLLDLRDAAGKTRLRLRVAADGTASIAFLDENGDVQGTLTPEVLAGLQ